MDEMVTYWIDAWLSDDDQARAWAWTLADDLIDEDPKAALEFVFEVLKREPPEDIAGALAAGPLEDLLDRHGFVAIERVEEEARRNPKFRELLGIVYTHQPTPMPDEIRRRVNNAAGRS